MYQMPHPIHGEDVFTRKKATRIGRWGHEALRGVFCIDWNCVVPRLSEVSFPQETRTRQSYVFTCLSRQPTSHECIFLSAWHTNARHLIPPVHHHLTFKSPMTPSKKSVERHQPPANQANVVWLRRCGSRSQVLIYTYSTNQILPLALYMFALGRYLDRFMKDGQKDAFTW